MPELPDKPNTKPSFNLLSFLQQLLNPVLAWVKARLENLPTGLVRIILYTSAGLVLLIIIISLLVLFPSSPQIEAIVKSPGAVQLSDMAIPPLPARIQQGDYQSPFPPKPRWDAFDLNEYLPNFRLVLQKRLREINDKAFQELLQSIPD
jgi:hypothetical protein